MNKNMVTTLILLLGCGDASNEPNGVGEGHLIHSVRYITQWDDTNTDTPWSVTSNLGYQVTVEEAYLVHYAVQLIPCEEDTGVAWLSGWVSPAQAGHSGENDASVTPVPVAEALHLRSPTNLGSVSFSPAQYCQLHYLVGRGDESTENLPESVDMVGTSLSIRGQWTEVSTGKTSAFNQATHLPHGIILDLPENTGSGEIELVLSRSSATLFDDVNFQEDSAEEQIWQILLNAVNDLHINPSQ